MKYSIEEKNLIANNHPEIEIEDIVFEYTCATEGEESPADFICYFTEDAYDAFNKGEEVEGVDVTFKFRDHGANYSQKYITFNDFAQLYGSYGDIDYDCEITPSIVFQVVADNDGRFSITIPVFVRESKEDDDFMEVLNALRTEDGAFQFNGLTIGNQFAEERMEKIMGSFPKEGEKVDLEILGIEYRLAEYPTDDDSENGDKN